MDLAVMAIDLYKVGNHEVGHLNHDIGHHFSA